MTLPPRRPYTPIRIRLQVAVRQYCERFTHDSTVLPRGSNSDRARLTWLLRKLFPDGEIQLDHDPALVLRLFNEKTGKYTPDANDPAYLVWREKAEHQQKTTGRRPGASRTITTKGSDIWLKTKFARLEAELKPKAKIPSRGFQRRSMHDSINASKKGWKIRRKMTASRETKPKD